METGPLHPLVKDYYQKCHFNTSLYLFLPMFNLWSQIKTNAFFSYILEWQEIISLKLFNTLNLIGNLRFKMNNSAILRESVGLPEDDGQYPPRRWRWVKNIQSWGRNVSDPGSNDNFLHCLVVLLPCYCIAVVHGTGDDDLYSGFGKEDVAPALATHDLEYDPAFQVSLAFGNVKWQHSWKFWISQDRVL